jgi:hypothetical protein
MKIFKVGDKVKYLGQPGEITHVEKDAYGRIWYSVYYHNERGMKIKAKSILSTNGSVAESKIKENKMKN